MSVIIYAGNAADRNERAMAGAVMLGSRIADGLGTTTEVVGSPVPLVEGGWQTQLHAATPNLRLLAATMAERLRGHHRTILTTGRCAASIATLPLIAKRFPDAAIVWFDAHGDSNVPGEGPAADKAYLGGMVRTGAAGEWATGFGSDLDLANVILVGARDLDPAEWERVETGQITMVPVGPDLAKRLAEVIRGRYVYIHLDCDVLSAGLLGTEYQVPHGLSFADLREAFEMLAQHDIVGLEIAEAEDRWPDGRANQLDELLLSLQPVTSKLVRAFAQHSAVPKVASL